MLPERLVCEDFFFFSSGKKSKKKVALVLAGKRALFNDLKGIFAWHCLFTFSAFNSTHCPERDALVFCGSVKSLGFPLKWK